MVMPFVFVATGQSRTSPVHVQRDKTWGKKQYLRKEGRLITSLEGERGFQS